MAQMITAEGTRTTITPGNGKAFTTQELEGFVGGPLEVKELPGPLYAVSVRHAEEIGAELNKHAMAGHVIHMTHCEVEGKLGPDQTQLMPPPAYYGTVVFCNTEELES